MSVTAKTQSGYGKGITSEKMKRTRIRMFYWSTAAKMLFSKHAVHQHINCVRSVTAGAVDLLNTKMSESHPKILTKIFVQRRRGI